MLAILYFCLYMLVCTFIMLQLVVGIIVDNIEVAENMETMAITQVCCLYEQGLALLDFVEIWEELDPYCTSHINTKYPHHHHCLRVCACLGAGQPAGLCEDLGGAGPIWHLLHRCAAAHRPHQQGEACIIML